MKEEFAARYPRSFSNDHGTFTIRLMQPTDADEALAVSQTLPAHDLLFLPRDISEPRVMAAWMDQLRSGEIASLVISSEQGIVGFSAVVTDPRSWSPHVGELRVLLSPAVREFGLGRTLIQESFLMAVSRNLEKLTAHMTADQKGAIAVFQDLGFITEALLRDHVRDPEGETHDIFILSHNVAEFQARMVQYGLDEALG